MQNENPFGCDGAIILEYNNPSWAINFYSGLSGERVRYFIHRWRQLCVKAGGVVVCVLYVCVSAQIIIIIIILLYILFCGVSLEN